MLARMKTLALLLCLCSAVAVAEKMTVEVIAHTVGGSPYTQSAPGMAGSNGGSSATCGADGSANCAGSSSTSSVFLPTRPDRATLTDIVMTLLLPDGRRVDVGCEDRPGGFIKRRGHNCKNPTVTRLEADFSADKVKLTWSADGGGKKKDSETFTVLRILPASTASATP